MNQTHPRPTQNGDRRPMADRCEHCPAGDAPLGRAVIDSRETQPGDVFWALRGVTATARRSCPTHSAAARPAPSSQPKKSGRRPVTGRLQVRDTQQALHQAARSLPQKFDGSVIAVTGSVGKTTTRQMIHTVLGAGGPARPARGTTTISSACRSACSAGAATTTMRCWNLAPAGWAKSPSWPPYVARRSA